MGEIVKLFFKINPKWLTIFVLKQIFQSYSGSGPPDLLSNTTQNTIPSPNILPTATHWGLFLYSRSSIQVRQSTDLCSEWLKICQT